MPSLPGFVHIFEEGPREGFQIEKGPISTARKIEFIDALARTGLKHIITVSFVNPKLVPGMADAEDVIAGLTMQPGVTYTGLWLNEQGLHRAIATGRLTLFGSLSASTSPRFLKRNQNRTPEEHMAAQDSILELYKAKNIPIDRAIIAAAFGSNFDGDVTESAVVALVRQLVDQADRHGLPLKSVVLADTMAWGTPLAVKRTVGAVQDGFPELDIVLHLHDTRGMGIANAFAGLEMGVSKFDSSVAGLGGCPFAGHAGAAGNVCTEDLVFMCHEMGVETGVDLEQLIECARLAEDVVGHPLPGSVMRGGSLKKLREALTQAA